MKRNLILTLVTFSIFILCGCNFSKKIELGKNNESKIDTLRTLFKNKPFKSISSVYNKKYLPRITYPSGIVIEGYCGLIYNYKVKKVNFDSVVSNIRSNAKVDFKLSDSTVHYTPSYERENIENKFPIPNFINPVISFKTEFDLKKTKIFIFDNGKGNFFKKEAIDKILTWTNINNPDFKGKGYSTGALVDYSNYAVIYWTIIW